MARKKVKGGIKLPGPFNGFLAGPLEQVNNILGQAKKWASKGPILFVIVSATVGMYKASRHAKLQDRIDAMKDARRRATKLQEVRAHVVGPLRKATEDLVIRLDQLMAQDSHNFFSVNFRDNPDLAVDSTLYLLCKFFFWRWQLEWSLQFEKMNDDDRWFVTVNEAFKEISTSFAVADGAYAAYDDGNKFFDTIATAARANSGKIFSPGAGPLSPGVAADVDDPQVKWPFRLLPSQRQAIGELMAGKMQVNDRAMSKSFTEFVTSVEKARLLQKSKGGKKEWDKEPDMDELASSAHLWMTWVLPLRDMVVRFANLQSQDIRRLHLKEVRELTRTRLRIRAILGELRDLNTILDRDPGDKWFRKTRYVRQGPMGKKEAARRRSARARWVALGKRIPHILMRAEAGGDAWPDADPPRYRRFRLFDRIPIPFTRVLIRDDLAY